jgi:hypothetical protein
MKPWREVTLGGLLEAMARAGYAARGFVYVSVGLIALFAAVEWTDEALGGRGAFEALALWPLGFAWLTAVGFGLIGFAGWRALQALFDADRQGRRPKALASRIGQAISGLVYGGLALTVFEVLDEVEDIREADEDGSAQAGAAAVLTWPYGHWLLIGGGLFIMAVGAANMLTGVTGGSLGRRLGCGPHTHRWACRLGRLGYFGRGIAFLPLGFFLCEAGFDLEPGAARTLGGALQSLETQPFGSWVLAFTAVGVIAFGLFAFVEARFRRIDVPDEVAE